MALVTQTVRETALLVEREPRSSLILFMRETAQLNEITTVKPFSFLKETAQLNDGTSDNILKKLREVALLNDHVTRSVINRRSLKESARVRDRVYNGVRRTEVVTEAALISDAYDYVIDTSLKDTAKLNDYVSTAITSSLTIREQLSSRDRARPATYLSVRESAALTDSVEFRTISKLNVRETALVSSQDTAALRQANVLREVASLNDAVSARLTMTAVFKETAYLYDKPVTPSYGRAYTCSIITWGMSTYSNFPFLTMAGKFAAGNNLWSLGAPDDFGVPISWHIKTGVMDFKIPNMKHMAAIYVAGSAEAPITVTVAGDVNGVKEEYDYDLELRNQDDYRNNRVLLGKGFRSRFFQVKLSATDIKARLLTADADIATSDRRI